MPHLPRCTKCGNLIPTWTITCPVCANMAIAAKKFGSKKVKPIWQQQAPPVSFRAPALPPGFKAPQKPQPIPKKVPSLGVKTQLSGINRLLTDIYKKPARFSSILQANGVTPAEIQQFMGSPAKIAKFLTLFLTSMSQTLAQKHGHDAYQVLDTWYGFEHPKLKSPKAIAGHCGLTVAQVQKLRASSLTTLRGLAKNGWLKQQILSAYAQAK